MLSKGHLFDQFGRPRGIFSKFCIHAALKIMLPNEGGEHFSNKNDENSVETTGLNMINTNGTVDGTRNAHPRGPKKQKYTFFQWILQTLRCNKHPQQHLFDQLGVPRRHFFKILLTFNFQNYASHRRRGTQFQKNVQKLQEEGVLSHKMGKKKADDA